MVSEKPLFDESKYEYIKEEQFGDYQVSESIQNISYSEQNQYQQDPPSKPKTQRLKLNSDLSELSMSFNEEEVKVPLNPSFEKYA